MSRADDRFRIAGDLLAGPDGDGRWNNLGYWPGARDYTAAARELARQHGALAGIRPGLRVLELACGFGAGLELWQAEFGVTASCALERREACARAIAAVPDGLPTTVVQGRFDEPLVATVGAARFDAILCVDAAYHARSLAAFLETCAPALAPDGVLVFSTVARGAGYDDLGPIGRTALHWVLRLADIPAASVCDRPTLPCLIDAVGLQAEAVRDLSHGVFAGFASWVERRDRSLGGVSRWSRDWLKIRMTARLCRWLARTRAIEYLLVVVRNPQPPSRIGQQ